MTPVTRWAKKAERLYIQSVLEDNQFCEACGKMASTCHHFVPKSKSSFLRCDKRNLVPICMGCHLALHTGDPEIQETIIRKRGKVWYEEIIKDRRIIIKNSIGFWKQKIEEL